MTPRLGHIELFVRDPIAVQAFYVDILGFRLEEVQGGKYVWVDAGGLSILLRPGRPNCAAATQYGDANSALVLYVDDADLAAAELAERGVVFRGTDGSPKCRTFTDPEGHWFQLVNPADL